jgi:hypothetical protein
MSVENIHHKQLIFLNLQVKVTFRDEPGEGTGVARHFYAAIAEVNYTKIIIFPKSIKLFYYLRL